MQKTAAVSLAHRCSRYMVSVVQIHFFSFSSRTFFFSQFQIVAVQKGQPYVPLTTVMRVELMENIKSSCCCVVALSKQDIKLEARCTHFCFSNNVLKEKRRRRVQHNPVSVTCHVTLLSNVVLVTWCQNANGMTFKNGALAETERLAVDSWTR